MGSKECQGLGGRVSTLLYGLIKNALQGARVSGDCDCSLLDGLPRVVRVSRWLPVATTLQQKKGRRFAHSAAGTLCRLTEQAAGTARLTEAATNRTAKTRFWVNNCGSQRHGIAWGDSICINL